MSHTSRDDLELELAFGELVRSSEQDADLLTNLSERRNRIVNKERTRKRIVQTRQNRAWFWYSTEIGN